MRSFVVLLFICVKYFNYKICCDCCYANKNNNSILTESNNSQTVNTDILKENDNSILTESGTMENFMMNK